MQRSRWLPNSGTGQQVLTDSTQNPTAIRDRPAPKTEEGARPHIIWADDNADMRDYVCRLLSGEYEVTGVADGLAALEAVRRVPPDLILTDVMMPGLDGFGLLRELRSDDRTRELPVILLSARAGEEARIEGLTAGADDYLTKPFSAKELLARVSTHLALSKLRREAAETLRESEARFRNMADNSPVIIWVTDPTAQCTYLNKKWYEFTGMTMDQGLGFGWLDSVHPDDRAGTEATFVAANEEREAFRLEYQLRRHDGEYRWAIGSAAPRFGADGEFLGYIGSTIDITELKQSEHRLRETDRRKDEFLAMLAHELRNPLAPIRTGLELMKDIKDDPVTLEETRATMERQTRQLIALVDDLLDVSRITRGKLELRKLRVSLDDVMKSALEASQPFINDASHELTVSLCQSPIYLDADPHRLAQVLSNLLNNAAKYTPAGGHIWLTSQRDGDQVVITVKDTGVGIPAEMLDQIFEMFTQVDRPMEEGYTGLGIGLTLVKRLVEMHDGEIEVHSDGPAKGSEFSLRLPILSESPSDRDRPSEENSPSKVKGLRILVVDDNADSAKMLGMVVKMHGNDVQIAYDGIQAVQIADEYRPDVVLMDLGMPRMNGYEAARAIRKQEWGGHMSLIALTGWGQEKDRQRTAEAGFDHHLVKPADPAELRTLIANIAKTREPRSDVDAC